MSEIDAKKQASPKLYVVGLSIERTVAAPTAPMAVREFLDWLWTTEGNGCITAVEKEKAFKPKRG